MRQAGGGGCASSGGCHMSVGMWRVLLLAVTACRRLRPSPTHHPHAHTRCPPRAPHPPPRRAATYATPAPSPTTSSTTGWRWAAAACASTGERACGRAAAGRQVGSARAAGVGAIDAGGAASLRPHPLHLAVSPDPATTARCPTPTHRRDIQARVFATIGLSDEEARSKFGYLLDAFEIGAPPHGGERRAAPCAPAPCAAPTGHGGRAGQGGRAGWRSQPHL